MNCEKKKEEHNNFFEEKQVLRMYESKVQLLYKINIILFYFVGSLKIFLLPSRDGSADCFRVSGILMSY